MLIRAEQPSDADAIGAIVTAAFAGAPHSDGTEAAIVDALRNAGALAVSLIAEDAGEIVGHVAFSPVTIEGSAGGWFGLGPLAVRPDRQRCGIGDALVRSGLGRLRELGAAGCVVVGDPAYYSRFGFVSDPALRFGDLPPPYLQLLSFSGERPAGNVAYHEAFAAT